MAAEPTTYAARLRKALDREGWSQLRLVRALAERTGNAVDSERSAVRGYLRGATPRPDRARMIAEITGDPELGHVDDPRRSAASRLEDHLEALAVEVTRLLESQADIHAKLDRILDALEGDSRQQRVDPR